MVFPERSGPTEYGLHALTRISSNVISNSKVHIYSPFNISQIEIIRQLMAWHLRSVKHGGR